jgi:hypothetical protein
MSKQKNKKEGGFKVPRQKVTDTLNLKPVKIIEAKLNAIIAFVVFAFTMIIYQMTNAPSLSYWDAGEYATTINIFSVLHAPGNPLYVIVGRFLNILGLGMSAPQIASFFSSLLGALAVMFTYLFSMKLISMFEKKANIAVSISIIASLFTAFSFTFWTNSIEAEVYSGLAFFINFIIYLLLVWVEKSEDLSHQKYLIFIIYLFFLGFGYHQTVLQIVPAVLLIAVYPMIKPHFKTDSFWTKSVLYIIGLFLFYVIVNKYNKQFSQPLFAAACAGVLMWFLRDKVSKTAWLLALFAIVIGFSSHLYIPIRASFRPFINEGDPHTWDTFWSYFNREQFGGTNIADRNGSFWSIQMGKHFFNYFNWQFFNAEVIARFLSIKEAIVSNLAIFITYLTGLVGMFIHARRNKHSFVYLLSLFIMGSIAMVFVMNIPDETPRPRDYFFVTAYNLWTVWMGMGLIYGLKSFFKKDNMFAIVVVVAMLFPTITLLSQFHQHNRAKEFVAAEYGMNFLNSLEENAIIFTNGDNDTFPLWYAQAVNDPYIMANQPNTNINELKKNEQIVTDIKTSQAIGRALDFKKAQCNGIRKDVSIANYSLLNTPWYIRQLRDREGIQFSIPDNQIEALVTPERFTKPVSYKIKLPGLTRTFTVREKDLFMGYWRGQDKATMQIIKDNFGKRPIYFASTVGSQFLGLDEYLENHVLVYKLVPYKLERNQEIRWDLYEYFLNDVYTVDSIADEDVYKDDTVARLIAPYIQHYQILGRYYYYTDQKKKALDAYDKGLSIYRSIANNALPGVHNLANRLQNSTDKLRKELGR